MARFILLSSVKATLPSLGGKTRTCAEVAELADALHSGCSTRQGVEVRVLSSAPEKLFSTNLSDAYVTDYFCLVFRTEQLSNNSYASFAVDQFCRDLPPRVRRCRSTTHQICCATPSLRVKVGASLKRAGIEGVTLIGFWPRLTQCWDCDESRFYFNGIKRYASVDRFRKAIHA